MVNVPHGLRQILICAKGWPPDVGGVQTYSEFVARAYLKAGFSPVAISSRPGARGWITVDYPEGTLRLWNVGTGRQVKLFGRMLMAARRTLACEDFLFVHPTTWRPALTLVPFRARLPMVLSVHGQEVLSTPAGLVGAMRHVLRSAQIVVAVSGSTLAAARTALPEGGRGDWFAAFNGLSYAPEAKVFSRPEKPDETIRIYSFCRLAERKNISGGLRALSLLRDRGIANFRYTIAGSGPLKAAIAAEIQALGLSDLVTMTGYLQEDEIADRYKDCDIFLHPQTAPADGNDLEGFGLAIADAMSFGALALVGKAGGPADFVRDDVNGLVVDGEDIDQIALALAGVLTDPNRLARIAAEGRRWALENLSWDQHVATILEHLAAAGASLQLKRDVP